MALRHHINAGDYSRTFRKQFFEITVYQKGPPSGPTIWLNFEATDPAKTGPKYQKLQKSVVPSISYVQSTESGILIFSTKILAELATNFLFVCLLPIYRHMP